MGWSGETQANVWQKIAVELEEEDLQRILNDNGLDRGLAGRLPAAICYKLLHNAAEEYVLRKLVDFDYPANVAGEKITQLREETDALVDAIADKLATT